MRSFTEKTSDGKKGGLLASSNKAVKMLKKFSSSNGYKFLSPLLLQRKGKEAYLDAVCVGYFGIVAIKTIDFDNGVVYGNATDKEWLWVSKSEERTYFPNPLLEAAVDMRVLRDALFAEKIRQIPIDIVCVFTSKKLQVALPASTGHYSLKDLKVLLRKEKYKNDLGFELKDVAEAIQKNN